MIHIRHACFASALLALGPLAAPVAAATRHHEGGLPFAVGDLAIVFVVLAVLGVMLVTLRAAAVRRVRHRMAPPTPLVTPARERPAESAPRLESAGGR